MTDSAAIVGFVSLGCPKNLVDSERILTQLRAEGYWIAALEITDQCQPYYAVSYPGRVALVLGNEDHGVTRATLGACDAAVFLPMYGKGRSLNVHVALAVVVYHILHTAD